MKNGRVSQGGITAEFILLDSVRLKGKILHVATSTIKIVAIHARRIYNIKILEIIHYY